MGTPVKAIGRERICNLLIARGLITREMAEVALKIQEKEPGTLIGSILKEMGYVKEDEIIETVLLKYNIPYLSPNNYRVNPEILAKVDKAFLLANYVFPLEKIGDTLSIITINPFNNRASEELEKIFGCSVRFFLGSVSEIEKAVTKYYG
jgi:hypothetical protein